MIAAQPCAAPFAYRAKDVGVVDALEGLFEDDEVLVARPQEKKEKKKKKKDKKEKDKDTDMGGLRFGRLSESSVNIQSGTY